MRILTRARGRADAQELMDLGVEHVYRETLDSALVLGREALRSLGVPSYRAHRTAQAFRRHDERALVELAKHRGHDHYVNLARRRIEDMEDCPARGPVPRRGAEGRRLGRGGPVGGRGDGGEGIRVVSPPGLRPAPTPAEGRFPPTIRSLERRKGRTPAPIRAPIRPKGTP